VLRVGPAGAGTGADPLADLLAAAAAPARDDELNGEEAAVAAFREARLAHVPQPRRKRMLKPVLASLLTAKVATATAVAAAVGAAGVVAATTGVLPVGGGDSPSVPPTSPTAQVAPSLSPTVTAQLAALCRDLQATAAAEVSVALDRPEFGALVTTAGGKEKVADYCAVDLGVTAVPGVGAEAAAGAGPDGAGVGVQAPGLGAAASAGPQGAGVGVQAPGVGAGAGADSQGAGLGVTGPGVGASAGTGPRGAGLGVGIGAAASATPSPAG
jgi:hypothetical protein